MFFKKDKPKKAAPKKAQPKAAKKPDVVEVAKAIYKSIGPLFARDYKLDVLRQKLVMRKFSEEQIQQALEAVSEE